MNIYEDNEGGDDAVIMCMSVVEGMEPGLPDCTIVPCAECDTKVWISADTVTLKARRLCNECGARVMAGADNNQFMITAATKQRLHDLGFSDQDIERVAGIASFFGQLGIPLDHVTRQRPERN